MILCLLYAPAMSETREQALYWPESMLREIQTHATRTDRSLSYIVQEAWKLAAAEIAALDNDKLRAITRPYAISEKVKQSLFFSEEMLNELHALSKRLDTSVSTIVQAAFVLAKPALESLPA